MGKWFFKPFWFGILFRCLIPKFVSAKSFEGAILVFCFSLVNYFGFSWLQ